MKKHTKLTLRLKKLNYFTLALCIFLSLSLAGCSSSAKDTADTTNKVTTESSKEKDNSIFQDDDKSNDNASSSTSSTNNNTQSTTPSTQTQQSTNTSSAPAQTPAQPTTKTESNNNRTVYYVPNSKVYHYSKSDGTLKKSKTILEMTEGEALAKGMHLTQAKNDEH